jgi:hypothetical protein
MTHNLSRHWSRLFPSVMHKCWAHRIASRNIRHEQNSTLPQLTATLCPLSRTPKVQRSNSVRPSLSGCIGSDIELSLLLQL